LEHLKKSPSNSRAFRVSFRKLASILGQCLWVYRIRAQKTFNLPNYRHIAKYSFPSPMQKWDDITELSGEPLAALIDLYDDCRRDVTTAQVLHPTTLTAIASYALLATDASYSKETTFTGFAYTFHNLLGDSTSRSQPEPLHSVRNPAVTGKSQIAIEELRTVLQALVHMRQTCEREDRDFPDLIMLGIDSMHAKGIITNGVARTDIAVALLNDIYATLGASRLYLTYVPSLENPADALSRPDLVWEDSQWDTLASRLHSLVPLATIQLRSRGTNVAQERQVPQRRA
jgi:hypothetical protein